jgi:effector-binding domain-containing protein
MKKLLIALVSLVILFLASVYLLIPSSIVVSKVEYVSSYQDGMIRFFKDGDRIKKWWKTFGTIHDSVFSYNGYDYTINKNLNNLISINIHSGNNEFKTMLVLLAIEKDSSAFHWETTIDAGINPITRILEYTSAKKLKENMSQVSYHLKNFLDKNENIYDIKVEEVNLKDSLLISTKTILSDYPTTPRIYQEVEKLKQYIHSLNGDVTDSAMLHIEQKDAKHYELMVGLPVNKVVPETKDISIKKMPFGKSMFITNIKGGINTVEKAMEQLKIYQMDTQRASPAIPYEMMITNRLQETDTTKWITRLYFPVM